MKSRKLKTDVVIYGAGPAGIIAALNLQKQGVEAVIVEKSKFPRFVIGESLLPKCMDYLEELDLIDIISNAGFQTKYGAIFERNGKRCSFSFAEQYSQGHSWTWQVKRADFDALLSDIAIERGIPIHFGTGVESVLLGDQHHLTLAQSEMGENLEISSKFIIDASGYGRVLPKLFDLSQPSQVVSKGSVFAHFEDPSRQNEGGNNIVVFSFNENKNWAWMIPFSDQTCSVGIVGPEETLPPFIADDYQGFKDFVAHHADFNGRFSDSKSVIPVKHIMGYSIGVKKMFGKGYVLCGNSTEFLDPIFSSGVTLAMSSGFLASDLVARELKGENIDWQSSYEDHLRKGIDIFRTYIDSWYNGDLQKIFFAPEIDPTMKEQICSVLAGHVWDTSNPFVTKHKRILKTLAQVIDIGYQSKGV